MEAIHIISRELNLPAENVSAAVQLLDEGATIPFIARYRKERTGSMDEVAIGMIRDRMEQIKALGERKTAIIKSLTERNLLTEKLLEEIQAAPSMTDLEDRYEKYRPKKRTRAQDAREKGLEPLAVFLLTQSDADPFAEAGKYISFEKGVESIEDALSGARDIIAETINEDVDVRAGVRKLFFNSAMIQSTVKKGKEEEGGKFKDYFDWSEIAFKAPSHRILAMFRGHNEDILLVHVLPDEEQALSLIEKKVVKNRSKPAEMVKTAVKDSYKRLLSKSMEKECMAELKAKADETAINVFASNVKELLLSAPLGRKRTLAIDPGFRTGCKVV
ncbi:MAG: Tex-like N-terminal domain-containing protein, partial [Desulfobacula sp.]